MNKTWRVAQCIRSRIECRRHIPSFRVGQQFHQVARSPGVDRPMRNQDRARPRMEKRPGEPRQAVRAVSELRRRSVARGQHNEVRVELEPRDIRGNKQSVVPLTRWRHDKRWLPCGILRGQQTMRGERDHSKRRKVCIRYGDFGRGPFRPDVAMAACE